jgi:hypothetical protein
VGIEKVPGEGERLGTGEIVGGADATKDVGDTLSGAATLVGVQEIAASTVRAADAFNT